MPRIELRNRAFHVDGRPTYLSAAEIQYFRTPRRLWRRMIRLAREANNNAVSSYVPWSWHEPEEGRFDFDGRTHPMRDLRTFLDEVAAAGLMFVCKPGPYVFGEISDGGHPQWLLDSHPEILALGPDGKRAPHTHTPVVTFAHPEYEKKVGRWFDALTGQVTSGYDNIALWQVDNETCYTYVLLWNQGTCVDYHPLLTESGLFAEFLRWKFGTVARLNRRYGTGCRAFDEFAPPRNPAAFADKTNVARGIDWIEFKAWLIGRFHKRLAEMLYERGVKGPFCVNQPLNGLTGCFPLLQRIFEDKRFQLGIAHVDHCGEVTLYNVGRMVGNATLFGPWTGSPLVGSLESQASNISGMWSASAGGSYNIYYRMMVAAGFNFHTPYWFNDGENVEGRGFFKREHRFESAVDHRGQPRYHYDVIRRVNGFLMRHPEIVTLEPVYDVALGHCREYDTATRVVGERELPVRGDLGNLRNSLVWTGRLFTWVGLEDQELSPEMPLVAVSYAFLPRVVQEKLVDFVARGGRLILFGQVPFEDEDRRPCRVLTRALGVRAVTAVPPTRPKYVRNLTVIDMFGREILQQEPVRGFRCDGRPIATVGPHVAGFEKRIGRGRASVLGFHFRGYTLSERECLSELLGGRYRHSYLRPFVRRRGRRTLTTWLNLGEEDAFAPAGGREVRVPPKNARFVYFDGRRHHIEE